MDQTELKKIQPEKEIGIRAEDLSNQIFNNWKVLYRTNNIGEKVAWVCECQCKNKTIKVIQSRNLKHGLSRDCGCGRIKTNNDRLDKKIHKRDDQGNIILKHCFRCNQWLPLDCFQKNKAQKDGLCGECKNCQRTAKENRYNTYKKGAKKRNLEFNLSKEEFYELTEQSCFYCGNLINYNGIDRVNSSEGYNLKNCVPCCDICNRMKLDYDLKFWIEHMQQIIKYMENKNE